MIDVEQPQPALLSSVSPIMQPSSTSSASLKCRYMRSQNASSAGVCQVIASA